MRIVADDGILAVKECFAELGELRLLPGRKIGPRDLRDADVLLVRSITQVGSALLSETPVRFVGTATSGTDHVDRAWLDSRGIEFADARGSNADAVVDYCLAALAHGVQSRGLNLEEARVGIVGCGQVGGRLRARLGALGIDCLVCDPPLAESSDDAGAYVTLEQALACDVVSLHVPLSESGKHPTANLLHEENLPLLRDTAMLINTCRGGVVDERALLRHIHDHPRLCTVFDVFAGEPDVDASFVRAVTLATPHIAGYSEKAKRSATTMLLSRLKHSLGEDSRTHTDTVVDVSPLSLEGSPWTLPLRAFDLEGLSQRFKASMEGGGGAESFDALRKRLLQRREFCEYRIEPAPADAQVKSQIQALGFVTD